MTDAAPAKTSTTNECSRHMTWEEWLAWAPEERHTEWVEGSVIEMTPVSSVHDAISQWLIRVLGLFIRHHQLGELRAAPSVLKLSKHERGREPDLMFVSRENLERLHPTYVEGPVDAVWEIVSPESVARDRGEKFVEYETEGIHEYWLIDPEREQIELYRLGDNGRYQQVIPVDSKFESSALPNFYLRPEWLWSTPPAMELDVLRELGVL